MVGLIVARSKNNVIGKNGQIPWRIKGEQKQFKKLTTGNVVVMGRKSYEEIGHPLPNRKNIIVSRTKVFERGRILLRLHRLRKLLLSPVMRIYILPVDMDFIKKLFRLWIKCISRKLILL